MACSFPSATVKWDHSFCEGKSVSKVASLTAGMSMCFYHCLTITVLLRREGPQLLPSPAIIPLQLHPSYNSFSQFNYPSLLLGACTGQTKSSNTTSSFLSTIAIYLFSLLVTGRRNLPYFLLIPAMDVSFLRDHLHFHQASAPAPANQFLTS